MIVKMQQAISTTVKLSSNQVQVLIYNEDKSILYEGALSKKDVKQTLGKRPKAYFEAELVDTRISILKEVEAQNW